jgi:hypothetical protein
MDKVCRKKQCINKLKCEILKVTKILNVNNKCNFALLL